MDFGKLSISNIKRQQQQQQSPNFNRSNNMKNNFNKSSITRKQRQEFASSLALLNQRKFLECGLCLQLFVRPRRLPCSHVFCTDCLVNLRNNMTNGGRHHVVVCPECKQQHSQPVEQMQLDYLVNGLVENIKLPLEAVNQSGLDLFQPNLHYIETNNLFDSDENMHGNVQIAGNTITAIEDIASAVARYEMTHVAVGACKLIPKEYIIVYMEMEILHMNGYMISLNIGDNCFTSNGQYCSWDASEYRYRWNPYGKGKFGKGNVVGAGLVFPPETMCDSAEHGEYGNNGAIRPAWMFYTIDGIAGPTIRMKPHEEEPDDLPLLPRVCMSDAGSEVRMNFGERAFMYDVCAHQFPYQLQYT